MTTWKLSSDSWTRGIKGRDQKSKTMTQSQRAHSQLGPKDLKNICQGGNGIRRYYNRSWPSPRLIQCDGMITSLSCKKPTSSQFRILLGAAPVDHWIVLRKKPQQPLNKEGVTVRWVPGTGCVSAVCQVLANFFLHISSLKLHDNAQEVLSAFYRSGN